MMKDKFDIEKIKRGLLYSYFEKNLDSTNYITKRSETTKYTFFCFRDNPGIVIIDDTPFTVQLYFSELYQRNFNTILIFGLGLGILSFLCQEVCTEVDVVDIDDDLIEKIEEKRFLKSNVNLIHGNAFQYQTQKKYDVICLDCWNQDNYSNLNSEIIFLQEKFKKNLNEGGIIYTPIIKNILSIP